MTAVLSPDNSRSRWYREIDIYYILCRTKMQSQSFCAVIIIKLFFLFKDTVFQFWIQPKFLFLSILLYISMTKCSLSAHHRCYQLRKSVYTLCFYHWLDSPIYDSFFKSESSSRNQCYISKIYSYSSNQFHSKSRLYSQYTKSFLKNQVRFENQIQLSNRYHFLLWSVQIFPKPGNNIGSHKLHYLRETLQQCLLRSYYFTLCVSTPIN